MSLNLIKNFSWLMHNRIFTILGFVFIVLGLLVNPWTLGYFFSRDGNVAHLSDRLFIGLFEFFCLFFGAFIFWQRALLNKRRFLFSLVMVVLVFATIEGGLHVINFFVPHSDSYSSLHKRFSSSPYKNRGWAKILKQEMIESESSSGGYHGRYLNFNSNQVRKTWNPENFGKKKPKGIYTFGGSSLWGDGARDDYTIPSHLSKVLNQKNSAFVVHNYGERGFGFRRELGRLFSLLKEGHRPDFVLFYDGFNDVIFFAQSEGNAPLLDFFETDEKSEQIPRSNEDSTWEKLKGFFGTHSMVYKTIIKIATFFSMEEVLGVSALSRYNDKQLYELAKRYVDDHRELMGHLDRWSKDFGFQYLCFWQPVVLTEPKLTEEELKVINPALNGSNLELFFKLVNQALQKVSIPHFFNISDLFQGRTKLYYTDWVHVSEEANEVVATKMAEIFEREFLK